MLSVGLPADFDTEEEVDAEFDISTHRIEQLEKNRREPVPFIAGEFTAEFTFSFSFSFELCFGFGVAVCSIATTCRCRTGALSFDSSRAACKADGADARPLHTSIGSKPG